MGTFTSGSGKNIGSGLGLGLGWFKHPKVAGQSKHELIRHAEGFAEPNSNLILILTLTLTLTLTKGFIKPSSNHGHALLKCYS